MRDERPDRQALAVRYRASLADKARDLAVAWDRWLADPDDAAARDAVRLIAHRLAGSAEAYGYSDLGRHALAVDEPLTDWASVPTEARAPARVLRDSVTARVGALQRALARAARDDDAGDRHAVTTASAAGPLVLYVDDDHDQCGWWRDVLSAEGLRVRTIDDPLRLREAIVVERPDVLLVDYWLGDVASSDLVAALRASPSFATLPIVCFTVDDGVGARNAAMAAGFNAVVRKSVLPRDLARLLREVAGAGRAR
jgi:two-component system cell cycle response regulator DivK